MAEFTIGPVEKFSQEIETINIFGDSYFLIRNEGHYKLLSAYCPHMGNTVKKCKDGFLCPVHLWKFDKSGQCITSRNDSLQSFEVKIVNNLLVTDIPLKADTQKKSRDHTPVNKPFSINLHAHACLEFSYENITILTDPWLDGPAFMDSWYHYPDSGVRAADLNPTFILITHEHSDHFHLQTLAQFDRSIPIIIPAFPNKRMEDELYKLGFKNVISLYFGASKSLTSEVSVTFFEPKGIWNDAIFLLQFENFRFLGLNDAGINDKIAETINGVDVIASTFSFGASGFPLTWDSISDTEKTRIMHASNAGRINQIRSAMSLYKAKTFLPYASHIALPDPTHEAFMLQIERNNVPQLKTIFKEDDFNFLDILPGESWEPNSNQIHYKWKNRSELYQKPTILSYLKTLSIPPQEHIFSTDELSQIKQKTITYFEQYNNNPQITFANDDTIAFTVVDETYDKTLFELEIVIRNKKLFISQKTSENFRLKWSIPVSKLNKVITENLSWDEPVIGYWCRFYRNGDEYHAGLWRLVQAPYFNKTDQNDTLTASQLMTLTVQNILDRYGENGERVLSRYGLYCAGCNKVMQETLQQALDFHAKKPDIQDRIFEELQQLTPITTPAV